MRTKFFIPIDRSSIRKNPTAGDTSAWRQTGPRRIGLQVASKEGASAATLVSAGKLTVEPYRVREEKITGNFLVTGLSFSGKIYANLLPGQSLELSLVKYGGGVDILNRHDLRVNGFDDHTPMELFSWSTPDPDYLFDYSPDKVTCEHCGASFPHTELRDDEVGDVMVENICPRCGEAVCCEVEYERIEDVKDKPKGA